MSRPRVVLMEDDAPIRSLVTFALDDLNIDLVTGASVAEATALLQESPAVLLIMDLMLPGESGVSFLRRHAARPVFGPQTRIAVFSAGLTPAMRAELEPLGVWRLLPKPAAIHDLRACVSDALAAAAGGPAMPPGEAGPESHDTFYGGNEALLAGFRRTCALQFPHDLDEGDAAAACGDIAALHALGHNLKTVLLILGHTGSSQRAASLEQACAARDMPAAAAAWQSLRPELEQLGGTRP